MDHSDEALMAAFAAGDPWAFERLYARHKTAMFNYFLRATGQRALAEELFQDLFLRVLRARTRYQPRRPFRIWLFTLARNLLRDRWRQLGRQPQWEEAQTDDVACTPATDAVCEQQEQVERLRAAVLRLPPVLREVLILSRYHELSFAEIAAVTSCSEATARVRAFRAIERLRLLMPLEEAPARAVRG